MISLMRSLRECNVRARAVLILTAVFLWGSAPLFVTAHAEPLEEYVRNRPAPSWSLVNEERSDEGIVSHLRFSSSEWQGGEWSHDLQIFRPHTRAFIGDALLYITGSGDGSEPLARFRSIASRNGVMLAVVADVPNQPLFDGRKEDALIAFTLKKFEQSGGDLSWPLLLPMVRAAACAMDVVSAFAKERDGTPVSRFLLSGASKRGWTTWLTAAVDRRVKGIAPMVFDMLNFREQLSLALASYGAQSEKIREYTALGLTDGRESSQRRVLREMIDPFNYRTKIDQPKLLLLGSNDPYWVVDSARRYFSALPGEKRLFYAMNTGHKVSEHDGARSVLDAWTEEVLSGRALATFDVSVSPLPSGFVEVHASSADRLYGVTVWSAAMPTRDFRGAVWEPHALQVDASARGVKAALRSEEVAQAAAKGGYAAYIVQGSFRTERGLPYSLSSLPQVFQ